MAARGEQVWMKEGPEGDALREQARWRRYKWVG